MTHVATLICQSRAPALDDATVDARARRAAGAQDEPRWLDPGIAADIPFTPRRPVRRQRAQAGELRDDCWPARPIDVVVQPRRAAGASGCSSPTWIPP